MLIEPEEIYKHTRIQTGAIALIDYNLLDREIDINYKRSTIAESHSSNSCVKNEAFAYMSNTKEEMARRFEEKS